MLPIHAYDDIAARARQLLQLYEGLLNTRKPEIGKDWAESFCRIMHWKKSSAIGRVDTKDAIIVLRENAGLSSVDFSDKPLADLLRLSLALGVSALDRYVHERVVKKVIGALGATKLSRQQQELSIPVTCALEAARRAVKTSIERTVAAYEAAASTGTQPPAVQCRPANEMRIKLQEFLHTKSFQSWREIEYAFELLGIPDVKGRMTAAHVIGDFTKDVQQPLNKIIQRRNLIVHEGDLVRHKRAGKVKPLKIERKFVRESLGFLDSLVAMLETVK